MNSKESIENCVVTENNDFGTVRNRLEDGHLLNALCCLLADFTYFAGELAILKNHIYCGKPLPLEDGKPYLEMYDFATRELAVNGDEKIIRLLHDILGIVTETAELTKPLLEHLFEGAELNDKLTELLKKC